MLYERFVYGALAEVNNRNVVLKMEKTLIAIISIHIIEFYFNCGH